MANGIIFELEQEALDESISIEVLLRKAYLISKKLYLDSFEEWVKKEQNGYGDNHIPTYRMVKGIVKAWNPYRGWIPILMQPEISKVLSQMPYPDPVSSLVSLLNQEGNDSFIQFRVSAFIESKLNEMIDSPIPTMYNFFVSKSEIYRIISTIRNKLLDWAILLDEKGIIGEGLTFSLTEREKAKQDPSINNYTNNFYQDVSNVDITQK